MMKKSHPRSHHAHRCPPCCHCPCVKRRSVARSKKSNISAERLTLLPGFLSRGVKNLNGNSLSPQDEDDCGVTSAKVRRSWRLCKKSDEEEGFVGFFNKFQDKGKSIFKEIKEKLKQEDIFDESFLEKLQNFQLRDTGYYKNKILEELEIVNKNLVGSRNMSVNRKRAFNDEDKENFPIKFPYVPPSNWVFQTPPNRKLNFNNVKNDTTLKPAVIETLQDKKVIYEMNSKINVDLTGFSNKQEVDIDKRYMVEVSTSNCTAVQEEDEKMDFLPNDTELENHFLSLTSRPKKVVSALPRFSTIKRKRDIFEPQPGCSTDEDYKPVCFLENLNLNSMEESFTFKFSNDDGGSTTGHLFDYDGNKKNTFNFRF